MSTMKWTTARSSTRASARSKIAAISACKNPNEGLQSYHAAAALGPVVGSNCLALPLPRVRRWRCRSSTCHCRTSLWQSRRGRGRWCNTRSGHRSWGRQSRGNRRRGNRGIGLNPGGGCVFAALSAASYAALRRANPARGSKNPCGRAHLLCYRRGPI